MRELFIYYRATQENASVLHAQVSRMQTELRARHPGLQARLLRRPQAADGLHTWMETYSSPDGIDSALQGAIESAALALAPWIEGPRHTEEFDACA
ncbi:DUF4936 family protein [Piscinibacter gummiphilus]|uniref:DUF4936 family protein n=1 Tax=Piscinibacter gummiphilus TaxID=946333 RepID=A0ABZ0D0N9_9BURK|nr:DUF4936 family protein [Piscinibacter gummiphilus]WOB10809.1 DUF4936 family protein [Piscinibacter gummiphilus]